MKLLKFLIHYSPRSVILAMIAGAVSGASNAALLSVFNTALKNNGARSSTLVWSFIGLCLLLPLTRFSSEILLTRLAQGALFKLRLQVSRQILAAPLRHLEELGAHRLMTALTEDIPTITGTLVNIPLLCINIAVAITGLIYLGWLSGTVLLAVLGFVLVGIITYQLPVIRAVRLFRLAREDADALFKHFRSLTRGTKELKLHRDRRRAFLEEILQTTALSMQRRNIKGMTIYTAASSWGQILVFVVIGLVLFALPAMTQFNEQALTGYTITLLYLMTPLQFIMNTMPNLSRANISLNRVEELGITLASRGTEGELITPMKQHSWDRLELSGVTHTYYQEGGDDNGFVLGPIDMTLSPGELVFMVGGNGSGKTTLAKLLTGLYIPESGEVRLNGELITDENREDFRQYFSVVFSDFHLFDSLLGLERPELDDRAREYLARLQLDKKVKVNNGTLSTTELSQGQRKRLALLTAYLEDRPIYLFDEWAADQDPVFKEVFYYQILPELKSRHRTILVISHDDKYYHVADRLIKLEFGKIEYDQSAESLKHLTADAALPFKE